jgi:hypothetical protein
MSAPLAPPPPVGSPEPPTPPAVSPGLLLALAAVAGLGFLSFQARPLKLPALPQPVLPSGPNRPFVPPEPPRPLRPWGDSLAPVGAPVVGTKVAPDGKTQVACDLPAEEKKKNVGGRDGAGLCVFTSIEYSARWQNERRLKNFQAQMRQEPGGGYPSKVDKMIDKYGKGTRYIQSTSKDWELVKAAIKSGRMPAVTYNGHDPHYRGTIAHMVSLAHADDTWVAVTDNNYPGDNQHVWLSPADFKERWDGWAVYLIAPPPPPPPRN